MWTKPYGMKEGFLIGGGLIIAGLMLELSVGPVGWDAFLYINYHRPCCVIQLYSDDVDILGASATSYNGRDAPVVFVLPAAGGHHRRL